LACVIAGPDAGAERLDMACSIAAAQMEVMRARRPRAEILSAARIDDAVLAQALATHRYEARALSQRKLAIRQFDAAFPAHGGVAMRDLGSRAGLKAAATGCRYKGYPSQCRQTNPRYPTIFRAWRRPLEVIVAEQARRAAAQLRRTNPGLAHSPISIQPNEPKSARPVNAILLPPSAIAYGETQAANSVCSPPPAGAPATLASRGGCGEGLGVGVQQTQKRRRRRHPQPLPTLPAR